ncbi:MAG: thiamine-phosphate kinase, partial [Chromatiaceae bacterium]|nr:thiamine-phosphate kinase [Chromatiaceae bacterium]
GARPGDQLWVSGTLGDAGLALRRLFAGEEPEPEMRVRLERPTPRVALGLGLRALATAMIDVSDGLAADLGHLLAASGVAAEVSLAELPLSPPVARALGEGAGADWALALASGDDYELCFSAPPEASDAIRALGERLDCPLTPIGLVIPGAGARWQRPEGGWLTLGRCGHDHFSEPS